MEHCPLVVVLMYCSRSILFGLLSIQDFCLYPVGVECLMHARNSSNDFPELRMKYRLLRGCGHRESDQDSGEPETTKELS